MPCVCKQGGMELHCCGASMSLCTAAVGTSTHESSSSAPTLIPLPSPQQPDSSMESPWASVLLPNASSPAVPMGNAGDGFGPCSCHPSDFGVGTEITAGVLMGSPGRRKAELEPGHRLLKHESCVL